MPRRLDGEHRAAELTRAVDDVLATDGPAGLTIRRIAAASGLSHASIYHQMGSREHLVRVAFSRTARARCQRLAADARRDLVDALLPGRPEELVEARCWLAWLEVTRVATELERQVRAWRAEELAILSEAMAILCGALGRFPRDDVEAVRAMALGLLGAMCQPQDAMPAEDAKRILRSHLQLLGAQG